MAEFGPYILVIIPLENGNLSTNLLIDSLRNVNHQIKRCWNPAGRIWIKQHQRSQHLTGSDLRIMSRMQFVILLMIKALQLIKLVIKFGLINWSSTFSWVLFPHLLFQNILLHNAQNFTHNSPKPQGHSANYLMCIIIHTKSGCHKSTWI